VGLVVCLVKAGLMSCVLSGKYEMHDYRVQVIFISSKVQVIRDHIKLVLNYVYMAAYKSYIL